MPGKTCFRDVKPSLRLEGERRIVVDADRERAARRRAVAVGEREVEWNVDFVFECDAISRLRMIERSQDLDREIAGLKIEHRKFDDGDCPLKSDDPTTMSPVCDHLIGSTGGREAKRIECGGIEHDRIDGRRAVRTEIEKRR